MFFVDYYGAVEYNKNDAVRVKLIENGGVLMKNPWEEISLADYESHMKLYSVMQLQAMNEMMKRQLDTYSISSVMILGIAGGNGIPC